MAKLAHESPEGFAGLGWVADVGNEHDSRATGVCDLGGGIVEVGLSAGQQPDSGAGAGEPDRDCATDPAPSAGHQRGAVRGTVRQLAVG